MIMFNHAFITIKGAIKNIQLTYLHGTIMGATYRRSNTAGPGPISAHKTPVVPKA